MLRAKQTELGVRVKEGWEDVYGAGTYRPVLSQAAPSETKPVELWDFKSTHDPTEYALLKRWDIDPKYWNQAQVAI